MTPTTKLLVNKTMSFCLNQKVITANKTKSTKEKFFEMYKSNPDLNKKEASRIINDKMGTTQGITNLEKFLQSKQPADRDPWETPKD